MPDYKEQEATNETMFREMNEWIRDDDETYSGKAKTMCVFICECSDRRCTDPIRMTRVEYEAVRAVPVRFAIALNHENPEIDRLFSENDRFATVEKIYSAGSRIARDTDPRRN